MTEDTYSFVFDKRAADIELPMLSLRDLILAVLAREPPKQHWEGCEVYAGDTPLDPITTRCIATRGPAADEMQQRLVEILEQLGIPILAVYDGGPESREPIARVRSGTWAEA